uniref:Uncharacterized protein n=1 Tax=Arundo donax TaxID=35708 RepID=A0A0A9BI99_ARUDO
MQQCTVSLRIFSLLNLLFSNYVIIKLVYEYV